MALFITGAIRGEGISIIGFSRFNQKGLPICCKRLDC